MCLTEVVLYSDLFAFTFRHHISVLLLSSVYYRLVYLSSKYTHTLLLQPHRRQSVEADHDIADAASCCSKDCCNIRDMFLLGVRLIDQWSLLQHLSVGCDSCNLMLL